MIFFYEIFFINFNRQIRLIEIFSCFIWVKTVTIFLHPASIPQNQFLANNTSPCKQKRRDHMTQYKIAYSFVCFMSKLRNFLSTFLRVVKTHTVQTQIEQNVRHLERTFIMLKPDAVQRGLIGDILKRFEAKGFRLVGLKIIWVS